MSEQLWSVEIVIGETELAAMDYAGTRVVGPDNYIVVNPAVDGSIPATIHIDVRAPNPGQAESEALQLYREIRERAQLPADEPSVLTVSRVVGVPHRADLWIFTAMDMLDQRRFGLAVIAA